MGAFAASRSLALRRRLGVVGALLAVTGLQVVVVGAMSMGVHVLVLALIALRSVHSSVSQVLVRAEVTPRLPQSLRATFLSLQSLVGRLGYSLLLLALGEVAAGAEAADAETLLPLLRVCAFFGVGGLVVLAATRSLTRREGRARSGASGGV